jgi:rhodanese-related sulfurtransferase
MVSPVSAVPAASSDQAAARFGSAFEYETDCRDVFESISQDRQDFVLLDARSPDLYAKGHVPGAINLPHAKIVEAKLRAYPSDTLFVVYCAGPHCNGAHRAALRLARLARPVKLMIGGVTGWLDEGLALAVTS